MIRLITLEKLKSFKVGDKITMYKKNIYGEGFPIHATIADSDYNYTNFGYLLKSGGWSRYQHDKSSDIECHALCVRLYKKRNERVYRTNFEIFRIEKGWI